MLYHPVAGKDVFGVFCNVFVYFVCVLENEIFALITAAFLFLDFDARDKSE